ncbi:MAG: dCTP diphosphatase [Brevundimonas sp.]
MLNFQLIYKRRSILGFFLILCNMDISKIQNQLEKFAIERDWRQFHTPKNLAMALSVEASELVEIFQWLKPEESNSPDQKQIESINDEVADIAMYLLRFCSVLEIDLDSAIKIKLERNAEKYPINLSKGNSQKYNKR